MSIAHVHCTEYTCVQLRHRISLFPLSKGASWKVVRIPLGRAATEARTWLIEPALVEVCQAAGYAGQTLHISLHSIVFDCISIASLWADCHLLQV